MMEAWYNNFTKGIVWKEVFLTRLIEKYRAAIAAFALLLVTFAANSTCTYTLYQEEIPEQAKNLRKF